MINRLTILVCPIILEQTGNGIDAIQTPVILEYNILHFITTIIK